MQSNDYYSHRWRPWERGKALSIPHASSKGFGAPAKKQPEEGGSKREKGKGAIRRKGNAAIDGNSSKVMSPN